MNDDDIANELADMLITPPHTLPWEAVLAKLGVDAEPLSGAISRLWWRHKDSGPFEVGQDNGLPVVRMTAYGHAIARMPRRQRTW